jgi:hypothetical protein
MRERNVQEKSNGGIRKLFSHHFRQEEKLVIMNPDKVTRLNHPPELFEKQFISFPIVLKVTLAEYGYRREIMKQRPDQVIAETAVEFFIDIFRDFTGTSSNVSFTSAREFNCPASWSPFPTHTVVAEVPDPAFFILSVSESTADTRPPVFCTAVSEPLRCLIVKGSL